MTSFRKSTLEIALGIRALAVSIVAALAGAWAVPALAQQQVPVFSWDPTVGWIGMGEFRPVPGKVPPVTNDPKHPYVPNGRGGQPTYRIADLSNPNLKPWVKERMKKDNDEVLAGKIAFTPSQSCVPSGVPGFLALGGNNNPTWFLQTPKEVRIMRDADAQVRRVSLNVPHSASPKPSWYGESVGHYEGDTLVIDTIGLNSKTFVDAYRTPHTEKLHVVERFKLSADGKMLEALVRIEDPDTFNEPLNMRRRWNKVPNPLLEMVCAENNGDHFGKNLFPVPQADRPDF